MNKIKVHRIIFAGIICFSLLLNLTGIKWGLPSKERADLVLPREINLKRLFENLAKARDKIYEIAEKNVTAYYGRLKKLGKLRSETKLLPERLETIDGNIPEPILHSLSSYLIRSKHPDENGVFSAIGKMKPEKLDFNPHSFSYGGMYLYTVALFLKTAEVLGYIRLTPDIKYYYANPDEMAKFFVVGRILTALMIFVSLILIYIITKNLYDIPTALLTMFLFSISPTVVIKAHIVKPHFFALPFACLTFFCAKKILDSGRTKWYILSGIFLGLTAGIIFNNFWLTGWVVILSHLLYNYKNDKRKFVDIFRTKIFLTFIISLVIFLIVNPYILVSTKEFLEEMTFTGKYYTPGLSLKRLFDFVKILLFYGLGAGVWILSLMGLILCIIRSFKGQKNDLFTVFYILPVSLLTCIIIGGAANTPALLLLRFMPIGVVIFCVLAARFILFVWQVKKSLILFVVALLAINLYLNFGYLNSFLLDSGSESNYISAGRWINANIPVGRTIGITAPTPHVDRVPPFRFTDYAILSFAGVKYLPSEKHLPEYFVIGENPADESSINTATIWSDFNTRYDLIKRFDKGMKYFIWRTKDILCMTNYPIAIYKLK